MITLLRRIPRQFRRSWTRHAGLTILIALGSVALITLHLVAGTLQQSFDRLLQDGRVEDARVWLTTEPSGLEALAAAHGCELEMRTSLDLAYGSDSTLRFFDHGDRIDKPVILAGRDLAAASSGTGAGPSEAAGTGEADILLDPAFASAHGLALGSTFPAGGKSWLVVGFCSLPDYLYPTRHETDLMTDASHFGIAVISRSAMQALAVPALDGSLAGGLAVDRSYAVRLLADSAPGRLDDFRQALTARSGPVRWLERKDNERINMVKGEISGLRQITSTLPAAIFLINCLLLATILWRMIRLEYRPIGTLLALGASRGEIMLHYLTLPAILAVAGAGLGTLAGLLLARPVLGFYADFFNLPYDRILIDPPLFLASILLPIALLILTAAAVIMRALRQRPVALMRGFRHRPKAMLLERHLRFRRFRFETRFRIRQSVRSSGKLFAAFLGVASATLLLLMGFMVQNSYSELLDEGFRQTFRYSRQYLFKTEQTANPYGGEPFQLQSGQEVESGETVLLQGLPATAQLLRLQDARGKRTELAQPAISRVLADRLHLKPGDTIAWRSGSDSRTYEITIGSITEVYSGKTIYMELEDCNRMLGKPAGSFLGIYSADSLPIPGDELYLTQQMDDVIRSFDAYAGLLKMALLGLGLLSGLMSALILHILVALLIEENAQSIAMLRILGYEAREIRLLMLRTFNLPVILGFAAGVPLLFLLYGRILESSFQEIDMAMPLRISPWYVLIGGLLISGIYLLARMRAGRRISRIAMSSALKDMQE